MVNLKNRICEPSFITLYYKPSRKKTKQSEWWSHMMNRVRLFSAKLNLSVRQANRYQLSLEVNTFISQGNTVKPLDSTTLFLSVPRETKLKAEITRKQPSQNTDQLSCRCMCFTEIPLLYFFPLSSFFFIPNSEQMFQSHCSCR